MEFLALEKHLIWVLPLLIAIVVVAYWALSRRRRAIALLTQGSTQCNLRSNAGPVRRRILATVLFLALSLSLIAVLRPIGGSEISQHRRPAKNLVVLLDVSRSMSAIDAEGISRIEAAKLLLREFINKRPTDRIGLVSFAGATYTESPVTLDRSILLSKVNQIGPGDIPVGGTDIDSALREAQNLLTENPPPGSAVIILSDGDNVTGRTPDEVLTLLKKAQIPVLSIALGLDGIPANVPTRDVSTKAEHSTLKNLSDSTNGLFLAASPKEVDSQVSKLSSRVDAIELNGENIAAEVFERPLDLYAWPLSIALLCLMIHLFLPLRSKVWRPLTAVLAISLFLPSPVQAQVADSYQEALAEAKKEELPLLVIFTGSDWSELSITFEREILNHQVFKKWADAKVIRTVIDLPRVGLEEEERNERRTLARKLTVSAYPMAVFLDNKENILGTLTHDTDGPASWVQRAKGILSGDEGASDSIASFDYLSPEVRKSLNSKDLTDAQRSVRFYNKALELEKADPLLSLSSKDRFKLLSDLYNRAVNAAPTDRPDLTFAARLKLALLNHRKGQDLTPETDEELQQMAAKGQTSPKKLLESAKRSLQRSINFYKQALPLKANDKEASANLALAYQNRKRVQAYLDFYSAYQKAVRQTYTALEQEKRFAASLEREVTTQLSINDKAIDESTGAIQRLIAKAKAIEDEPTILSSEFFAEIKLAEEDIALAPSAHRERDLHNAKQHLQDALDHLYDPQQQQPQQAQPDGGKEEEDGEEEKDEKDGKGRRQNEKEKEQRDNPQGDKLEDQDSADEEDQDSADEEGESDAENDLRRAEKGSGDLRARLMNRMRKEHARKGKRIPRKKDH